MLKNKKMKSFTYPLVQMVAVSLAVFIFDEIMRPSVTTYVSEGQRITLCYI